MEATIKTISIELLAEKLNGNLWIKGDMKRIYLDRGWNTKKMSTKTYVYQRQDGTFGVSCTIDCPSQDPAWISSQEEEIVEPLTERIDEIIEEDGFEIVNPQIAIQAALSTEEQVQGYYMRWHEVRVKINSYGKLAERKRQKVHTYKGAVSKTPGGFVALNDEDFAIAVKMEDEQTCYEYGNEPTIEGQAQRNAERQTALIAKEKEEQENKRIANEKMEEEKKLKAIELLKKIEELKAQGISDPLLGWKQLGCPHPAPKEVMDAKKVSGLNWRQFENSIQ